MSGSWRVPAIASRSPDGNASTWIGIQGGFRRGATAFFQVGTVAARFGPASDRHTAYTAFWTDTAHHYQALSLFRVAPGDAISARLGFQGTQRVISVTDTSTGRQVQFRAPPMAGARFSMALWSQEDSTDPTTRRPFPYPILTPVRFRELMVNAAAPATERLYSTWMTVRGHELAPTPLSGGSFTLRPATITPAGARYLRIASAVNGAVRHYEFSLAHWLARQPRARIGAATASYAAVVRNALAELAGRRWPASAQPLVDALIAANRSNLAATPSPVTIPPAGRRAWTIAWEQRSASASRIAHRLHSVLGLPDIDLGHK
jgi:hypothetical protein